MLRDLGGLFWRDDGHGLVVHVLLPLVRVRLEEGLAFVVVEELGVQLSAFLRLLRGLQLQDVDLLWFTLWLIGNWRSIRGVIMSLSVIIVIVIEVSEELTFGLFETLSVRHVLGEEGLLFRIGILT